LADRRGGLEALTSLLRGLPSDPALALVFVQHLSPDFESSLPSILSKTTSLTVVTAMDGMEQLPGHLYVGAPGKSVRIEGRRLHVERLSPNRGEPRLIDELFFSLAIRESLGIGLYIVGEVVRAHRGLVSVESSEEAGTTFRVVFPRVWVSFRPKKHSALSPVATT
jgi:two-component system CheB/CheR fusion protein